MAFFRRRKREKSPLPPVTTASGGEALKFDGRRLDMCAAEEIKVACACGHRGQVRVADLIRRHGPGARLREALADLRCSACGQTRRTSIASEQE